MARVWYDMMFKGGEYTDKDGKQKHRYQKMGKIAIEDDGRMWGVFESLGLESQFNVFPQQDKRDGGGRQSSNSSGQSRSTNQQSSSQRRDDLNDDIPF